MRKIEVIQKVLEANETIAERNHQLLDKHRVYCLNLMSAPGAGKTSLILHILRALKDSLRIGVIEGDVASTVDAERVQHDARAVVQINTRNMPDSCSLTAGMIEAALNELPLDDLDLVIIENIGNLICPSEFVLGEHKRAVISSVAEGDDKTAKYPLIFVDADAVVVNKIDLLPYVDFDVAAFSKSVAELNPDAYIFPVSCKSGEGIERWCSWVTEQVGTGRDGWG